MILLKEEIQDVQYLTEEKNGKKSYFIEGIFIQGDIPNGNNRVYPMGILQEAVNQYQTSHISQNRAFGELGHPDNPSIHLDRVSHLITELKQNGKNYHGKAKILSTPFGKIVEAILESGGKLGVSTRGLGSLKKQGGYNHVQSDFRLITPADIVADPSAPDAMVEGLMEGKEWVFVRGCYEEQEIEEAKTLIRKAKQRNLEEAKLAAFQNFMMKLTN